MFRTSPVHHQERFLQAVLADLVCGNTRTTRHVQPLLADLVCVNTRTTRYVQLNVSSSTPITTYHSYSNLLHLLSLEVSLKDYALCSFSLQIFAPWCFLKKL